MKNKDKFSFQSRIKSFRFALNGLKIVLKEEHNFRIHLVAAVLAVGLSVILEITKLEFIAVIIAIVLVLAAEIVNTCIEKLCDLISLEHNDQIKIIKDMAAASVLVSAIAAFIIGMVIFIPKTLF